MHAKDMTTRQISDTLQDIYDFETSEGFISDVADKSCRRLKTGKNGHCGDLSGAKIQMIYIKHIRYISSFEYFRLC